jgi:hypothetical protein
MLCRLSALKCTAPANGEFCCINKRQPDRNQNGEDQTTDGLGRRVCAGRSRLSRESVISGKHWECMCVFSTMFLNHMTYILGVQVELRRIRVRHRSGFAAPQVEPTLFVARKQRGRRGRRRRRRRGRGWRRKEQ